MLMHSPHAHMFVAGVRVAAAVVMPLRKMMRRNRAVFINGVLRHHLIPCGDCTVYIVTTAKHSQVQLCVDILH